MRRRQTLYSSQGYNLGVGDKVIRGIDNEQISLEVTVGANALYCTIEK